VQTEQSGGDTVVRHQFFSLTLPGTWKVEAEAERPELTNEEFGEQVIVAILEAKEPLDADQLGAAMARLAQHRCDIMREKSGGTARIAKPRDVGDGAPRLLFGGRDDKNGVQAYVQLRGDANRIVTMSYYRYGLHDPAEFGKRAALALSTFKLAD
jgi:hypothetical protein